MWVCVDCLKTKSYTKHLQLGRTTVKMLWVKFVEGQEQVLKDVSEADLPEQYTGKRPNRDV